MLGGLRQNRSLFFLCAECTKCVGRVYTWGAVRLALSTKADRKIPKLAFI